MTTRRAFLQSIGAFIASANLPILANPVEALNNAQHISILNNFILLSRSNKLIRANLKKIYYDVDYYPMAMKKAFTDGSVTHIELFKKLNLDFKVVKQLTINLNFDIFEKAQLNHLAFHHDKEIFIVKNGFSDKCVLPEDTLLVEYIINVNRS